MSQPCPTTVYWQRESGWTPLGMALPTRNRLGVEVFQMACVSDDESQLFSFDPYKPPKP